MYTTSFITSSGRFAFVFYVSIYILMKIYGYIKSMLQINFILYIHICLQFATVIKG